MQFIEVWQTSTTFAFQYRKRYGLHAIVDYFFYPSSEGEFQYRKRYGLHAIGFSNESPVEASQFQYRKRYGLHAISIDRGEDTIGFLVSIPQAVWIACNLTTRACATAALRFNTASGMDCMQFFIECCSSNICRFNTASGMDCMQLSQVIIGLRGCDFVSIPQAVWIACNFSAEEARSFGHLFQYRKRYGLHAMQNGECCQEVCQFQYRKRYGLHAIVLFWLDV